MFKPCFVDAGYSVPGPELGRETSANLSFYNYLDLDSTEKIVFDNLDKDYEDFKEMIENV